MASAGCGSGTWCTTSETQRPSAGTRRQLAPRAGKQDDAGASRARLRRIGTHCNCVNLPRGTHMQIGATLPTSFRLDMGGADHLGPFLGFVGEELAELGRTERKRGAAEIGKARLDFGISEGKRDLAVEL